jgi:hypothetical protein
MCISFQLPFWISLSNTSLSLVWQLRGIFAMIQIIYVKYKRYFFFCRLFCRFADFLRICRYFVHLQIFCTFADFLQICRFFADLQNYTNSYVKIVADLSILQIFCTIADFLQICSTFVIFTCFRLPFDLNIKNQASSWIALAQSSFPSTDD